VIETTADRLPESAQALFAPDLPNAAVRHALLAGANPSYAVVDDAARPAWCLVRDVVQAFGFIGGRPSPEELDEAVRRMRRRGAFWIVLRENESRESVGAPPPAADGSVARREFSGRAARADEWAARVPEGCLLRRIDAELLPRCRWGDDMARTLGGAERYLRESLGFCLVRGDAILAEAHAAFWAAGEAEIGGITAKEERGRGLAAVVAGRLVLECAARGATTVWSCFEENAASARVAEKLGYQRHRRHPVLDYAALAD
jgi:RimJ/RimL family protein N-acetyltransferase